MGLPEQLRKEGRKQIVAAAKDMLMGNIGVINGSRLITDLCFNASDDGSDPDFSIFVLIASGTDHLPTGPVRQYWATDSLAEKDKEIKREEDYYRADALTACEKLIERLEVPEQVEEE